MMWGRVSFGRSGVLMAAGVLALGVLAASAPAGVAVAQSSGVANPFAGTWSTFGGSGKLGQQVVDAAKGKAAVAFYSERTANCPSGTVYYTGYCDDSSDSGQVAGCTETDGRHLGAWYKSGAGQQHGTLVITVSSTDDSFTGSYRELSDNTGGVFDGTFSGDFSGSGRSQGALSTALIVAAFRGLEATDRNDVRSLFSEIALDAQQHQLERWIVHQQAQTKIVEIQEEITVSKARTQDKAFNMWDQYIREGPLIRAHAAGGQSPVIAQGRALCRASACAIAVTTTTYGRTLITTGAKFVALIAVTSTVPGYHPSLTVERAMTVPGHAG
jgi:hypothetical protein